ncbi:trypsin-like serine protease [Parasedimentitalea maritima]|uniref:Trypsin-like serine protease n=1 Tax=Parasedimentitalea maritima TaxID=2578117 RepID=A0ABY2V6I0_9RHOB|nr:trypsin-like serine protease [Zongyanglinia marina]TLP69329.1 trypsin-like serine protease [Zongyanglinia marina]
MRLFFGVVAACLMLAMPQGATAGDPSVSVRSVPGWEAVGRLNIAGRSMCTGALIAPNLVLTAAHCLYDQHSGRAIKPSSIRFEAGLNGRRIKAARTVTKVAVHPKYQFRRQGESQIGHDIAVLRLDRPISRSEIQPFAMAAAPQRGDAVGVLSYTHLQATRPSLEQPCHVLARQSETLVMSCRVEFGASGAPVLAVTPGQAPRVVSVVSAKAAMGNRRVSIGTTLDQAVQLLIRRAG